MRGQTRGKPRSRAPAPVRDPGPLPLHAEASSHLHRGQKKLERRARDATGKATPFAAYKKVTEYAHLKFIPQDANK